MTIARPLLVSLVLLFSTQVHSATIDEVLEDFAAESDIASASVTPDPNSLFLALAAGPITYLIEVELTRGEILRASEESTDELADTIVIIYRESKDVPTDAGGFTP